MKAANVQTTTFDRTLTSWISSESAQMKPSSHAAYLSILTTHLLPELGPLPPQEVTAARIAALIREKSENLSPSTVCVIAAVLRHALRYAEEQGENAACSAAGVPHVPRSRRQDVHVLSVTEQAALEMVLREDDPCDVGVLLALCTGLRVGELCGLRWGDVAEKSAFLSVRRTAQRVRNPDGVGTTLRFDSPKSVSSMRTIPIPARVAKRLEALRAEDDCYVLTGSQRALEPRTMQNRFKAYQRAAGLEPRNFHTLRHTFATRWMEKGFDVKTLSRVLGHADVSTTLNIYVHPSLETMRGYMDQM